MDALAPDLNKSATVAATAVDPSRIRGALVPMACTALVPTMQFFVERLGFRIDAIFPADAPSTAILSGHGVGLYLSTRVQRGAEVLHLLCDDPATVAGGARELQAPNGVTVRFVHADPPMQQPATCQALVLSRMQDLASWGVGRAGMRYRDLLPERHGGAFIASHIRILDGGPVPDYVHFHKIRFQLIFCRKGWVRVVYEGQGEPFVLQAGDCVLQPPMIRHRVLESSAGAEVVELGSPAEHITMADHNLPLPSPALPPDHDFSGQRFVRHVAAQATWQPWRVPGFEARDTGIAEATKGLATVRVVRAQSGHKPWVQQHDSEFCFYFVLSGALKLRQADAVYELGPDDSITIPGDMPYVLLPAEGTELLEVMLPADARVRMHEAV